MASVDGVKILEQHGIKNPKDVHFNLSIPELYEISIKRGEGQIVDGGSLVAYTGAHTGRSPKDRFIVKEPTTEEFIQFNLNLFPHIKENEIILVWNSILKNFPKHRLTFIKEISKKDIIIDKKEKL